MKPRLFLMNGQWVCRDCLIGAGDTPAKAWLDMIRRHMKARVPLSAHLQAWVDKVDADSWLNRESL